MNRQNPIIYRLSQFVSLLLGARIFILFFITFTLYVSAFFLFNREESLRNFVFDYKIHGIIFCSVLSIAAGGIINQFYDKEKDRLQRPFRARLQGFLQQKYFLYSYIALIIFSLFISWILSPRIFIFFLAYQFFIWFYSHKLSRILVLNNLSFVALSLYPFFGLLVYCQHFSLRLFLMACFLFLILLVIDILKDVLTIRVDKIFNYNTMPVFFGVKKSVILLQFLLFGLMVISGIIVSNEPKFSYLVIYYSLSIFVFILALLPLIFFRLKNIFWLMNLLRVWIFIGVIFMFLNGIVEKF